MRDHRTSFDVVIAGAGPVGLLLACELRLGGASVLKRDADPRSPLKAPPFGRRGLTEPSVGALGRHGLLDAVVPEGEGPRRDPGHFAGIDIDANLVDAARWPYRPPGAPAGNLAVELGRVEAALAGRAVELGAEVRRGGAVEGSAETAGGVAVRAGGRTVEGRWLVGCDGGRSAVRKAGGFAFEGTEPEFTGYSLDVELADPGAIGPGRHLTPAGVVVQMRPGVFGLAEFDGGAGHRAGPLTPERAEARVGDARHRLGAATRFHLDRPRPAGDRVPPRPRAARRRRGPRPRAARRAGAEPRPRRRDQPRLKLAAAARGDAPAGLLDSYAAERRPVAARVLEGSRAQVALMRPGPGARALEAASRWFVEAG